jgi:hypothetical protein
MGRAIERENAHILEMIEGLQADIDEADLLDAFKNYVVQQNVVSSDERVSLPNSAKEVCSVLASRFGWSITYTADTLFGFGTQSGIEWVDREAHRGASSGEDKTNWRHEGF